MEITQTNTLFFGRCKEKLEMYIKTGKRLSSEVYAVKNEAVQFLSEVEK